ncbi:phosphomannomutase [bacterium]|nr:phosphomannomutase [bacterium]MBU1957739.1 phosphomannomutase [bacterium]
MQSSKQINIEDKIFNLKDIKQLYPAVLVKTGHGDETTEVSLEWIDIESKGRVEIVGYGLFVRMGEEEKHSFVYENRETLDKVIAQVARAINH